MTSAKHCQVFGVVFFSAELVSQLYQDGFLLICNQLQL